jgi:uncharacterized membrane protein
MSRKKQTVKLTVIAILLAIAILLQAMASLIVFPITNSSPALSFIPIVVGAILYGPGVGALLGFVWSGFILVSGQASYYMGMNAIGTVITVIAKGTFAGLVSGLVYKGLKNKNKVVAIIIASIVAPLVNSLLYRVGLVTFFREYFFGKANDKGLSPIAYFVVAFTSASFFLEVGLSAIFSPIVARICNIATNMLGLEQEEVIEDEDEE